MLLDLGRNDVGRVANRHGRRTAVIRSSATATSCTSSPTYGPPGPEHDVVDALMAGFPAGTLSAPRKCGPWRSSTNWRKTKRGPYAGCVGYFSANGDMDTCIVLRTALVKDGVVHVQAGAGLVHDCVPEKEQKECINKARALFRAAEEAVRFATRAK